MYRACSLTKVVRSCCAALAAAVALGVGAQASAQIHGVQIGKSCTSPRCVGENTDCVILIGHGDGFGDTVQILDAFDIVDPTDDAVRVPAVGNLPIVSIEGNAVCADSGGVCDQSGGVNCALPCVVGPANSALSGLPGDPQAGIIRFRQNTYVILADDPSPLQDQANVNVRDLCDSPTTTGCSSLPNLVQFTASTAVTRCTDLPCQVEACSSGVCGSTSICIDDPGLCADDNACTMDVCNDALGDCCDNTPIVCEPRACFGVECNPASGCVYTSVCTSNPTLCNDDNVCTTDTCDTEAAGCCRNIPDCTSAEDCNDQDPCTTDVCTAAGCCENTPLCDAAADCPDDGNTCTTEICLPSGCCDRTPDCTVNADCDDSNECTTDTCENSCCVNTPECEDAADCDDDGNLCTSEICTDGCCGTVPVVCQDKDPCTDAICNPKTGTCSFPPTQPPPPECVDFDGCTPGFWKQPQHEQYWPAPYETDDRVDDVFGVDSTSNPTLLEALSTGGGGEIAFLRHAVAALLNSAHGDVDYAFTTAQVIAMVQAAYASGDFATAHADFAEQNELGCTVIKTPRGGNDRIGSGKKK